MDIKWLHAPGHSRSIGPNVIEFATSQEPTVIDWSEMYFNVDDLVHTALNYHHFIGQPKRTDRRGRVVNHDVILSVTKSATVTHQEEFFVCQEISMFLKYMPERWGKAMVFWLEDEIVLFMGWHPQPGAFRHLAAVMPGYRKSVRLVQAKQEELEKEFQPTIVMNGGDLQLPVGRMRVHPNKLAERLKMSWRNHVIDWQMWKGFGVKLRGFKTLDPSVINKGMDHLWTFLHLRKAT